MIKKTKDDSELKILRSIYEDLLFAIKWIETGYNPHEWKKGSLPKYLIDPTILHDIASQNIYKKIDCDEYEDYLNDESHVANQVLRKLSKRELEVFLIMKAEGMDYGQAAELLNLSTSTLQRNLLRAQKKIDEYFYEEHIKKLRTKTTIDRETYTAVIKMCKYDHINNELMYFGELKDEYEIINHMFKNLKPSLRSIVYLSEVDGFNEQQITAITQMKEVTIRSNYFYLQNEIRLFLGERLKRRTKRIVKRRCEYPSYGKAKLETHKLRSVTL